MAFSYGIKETKYSVKTSGVSLNPSFIQYFNITINPSHNNCFFSSSGIRLFLNMDNY